MLSVRDSVMLKIGRLTYFDNRIYNEGSVVLEKMIREMWECGALPTQQGKKWLVGYHVYRSFFTTSLSPIYVGPKKPSRFRSRHARLTIVD